jgi:hypothetical protein
VLNGRWIHVRFLQGGTPVSTVASASGRFIINGFFDPHTGEFHAIFDEFEHGNSPVLRPDLVLPRALPMEVVIDKPRGDGRFSAHTAMVQPLEPRGERPRAAQREMPPLHAPLCAVDLEDHSLWRIDPLDLRKPAREVTLPGGDRFVRLESAYVSGEARPRSFSGWCDVVLDDGSRVVAYGSDLIIAGERGLYAWNGSELTPFERDPSASVTDLEIVTGSHAAAGVLAYVDRDPIAPSVEVKSIDDSKVLFRFDYGPRNSHEHVTVAMIYAVNLVRSPLACVISFLTPASPTRASGGWSGVPLLYDQHRAWLLIAVLALAFFYTRSVIRTLSLRGASSWTIGVWALVTAIFGVYAYLLFRILEPRGALARVAEPAASPAPLLIESHAPERAQPAGSL